MQFPDHSLLGPAVDYLRVVPGKLWWRSVWLQSATKPRLGLLLAFSG